MKESSKFRFYKTALKDVSVSESREDDSDDSATLLLNWSRNQKNIHGKRLFWNFEKNKNTEKEPWNTDNDHPTLERRDVIQELINIRSTMEKNNAISQNRTEELQETAKVAEDLAKEAGKLEEKANQLSSLFCCQDYTASVQLYGGIAAVLLLGVIGLVVYLVITHPPSPDYKSSESVDYNNGKKSKRKDVKNSEKSDGSDAESKKDFLERENADNSDIVKNDNYKDRLELETESLQQDNSLQLQQHYLLQDIQNNDSNGKDWVRGDQYSNVHYQDQDKQKPSKDFYLSSKQRMGENSNKETEFKNAGQKVDMQEQTKEQNELQQEKIQLVMKQFKELELLDDTAEELMNDIGAYIGWNRTSSRKNHTSHMSNVSNSCSNFKARKLTLTTAGVAFGLLKILNQRE